MSNHRATNVKTRSWLRVIALVVCTANALFVSGCGSSQPTPPDPRPDTRTDSVRSAQAAPGTTEVAKRQAKPVNPSSSDHPPVVDDDGKTLWVSPTDGKPIDLGWLSPGAQIIAVLRPAALLSHPEGEKARAALGPDGQRGIETVEQLTGIQLADIERLLIGAHAASDGNWQVTFVVHARNPITREALLRKFPGAAEKDHDGKAYLSANDRAYYLPGGGAGNVLVVSAQDAIRDIIDLAGQPPPLRRDIERLIAHTDADRHATIIVAPHSLFSEGQSIFVGEWSALREALFWFLGDELSGGALSMHWDDNFFLELVATPTLETSPERAARIFSRRCREVPDRLTDYVAGITAPSHGQQLVKRLPAMLRAMANYTRSGFEPDHAVLRCYLPVVAGHNLLMAAELTLAESQGGPIHVAAADTTPASGESGAAPADVHQRLTKITSLRFARDTLEAALAQLSKDIGVPIVIRGPDLQTEGITKNQSFGIDISDRPAEEILVDILRLANPDKSAIGPSDPRQKLVYVIEQSPDEKEQIVVTTRARAIERKNELPAAFQPAQP